MILDSNQLSIQTKLIELAAKLEHQSCSGFLSKFFAKKNPLKSFYIYGDVGRGKSMLMKNFFDSLHETPKIYFHFNSFMRKIHEALRDIRKEEKKFKDELIEAVQRVVNSKSQTEIRVICFDEFQVIDIADAMLLARIFSYLFSQGVLAIFTSNSHPHELYKNGLQREVFLQFVDEVLLKNCEVLHLNSPTDYRARFRKGLTQRYFISNKENREELKKIINNFIEGKKAKSLKLKVWGREVKINKTFSIAIQPNSSSQEKISRSIAILTFDELCRQEFSASDYQTICQKFDLIFLLKLPSLSAEEPNEARRFTLFIDEIYENKTALIILAKTNPDQIYISGTGSEAFKRTISRLNEIKSDEYWQNSKINF